MSSNFFIRKSKGGVKRKINNRSKSNTLTKSVKKAKDIKLTKTEDSEVSSSEEENLNHQSGDESDDNILTAQEKKVVLAKKYLEEIEREQRERLESDDVQNNVCNKLREDLLDQSGKLTKKVADKIVKPEENDNHVLRCKDHKLSITCVVISPDSKFVFSGSKDAVIVKWSLESRTKLGVILSKHKEQDKISKNHSHDSSILSLAISYESKYLASSDESSTIQIWNVDSLTHVHSFKGHRASVTGLAFCCESNNLYSCSKDRSVRIWNLDEMSFVETLFGHQCNITSIDVLKRDRAVTSGGCDRTVRVWKVQEESQLIFNGHQNSIDSVKRLDQQHFVSCGDDGEICVWGILKKKPLCVISNAHGVNASNNQPNWITAVSCLPNSDLIVSGSCDGYLRFWKCEDNFRNVLPLFTIPVTGSINSIAFSKNCSLLVVGIGQEHKLGRWFVEKKARNSIMILKICEDKGI